MFSRRDPRMNRGRVGVSVSSAVDPSDLRQLGLGAKLLAYYDVRPQVSGAQASMTLSSTLAKNVGSTSPTVTCSIAGVKQVWIEYTLGGALGTMQYVIRWADVSGAYYVRGTSSAVSPTVNVGGSDTITFGAGTYVLKDEAWVECTAIDELTGLANAQLSSTLAGRGARYEGFGLNGRSPALAFNNSALTNELGVPALATGVDAAVWVWLLGQGISHISGAGASVLWGFSNQTDTTKSYLRLIACGPSIGSGLDSRYAVQRRDSGGAPATATLTCGLTHVDLDPFVSLAALGSSGVVYRNGMPTSAAQSTNRGVATNLNRFSVGGAKLGTAAFSSANWWQGRMTALAITTDTLTAAEQLQILKALA